MPVHVGVSGNNHAGQEIKPGAAQSCHANSVLLYMDEVAFAAKGGSIGSIVLAYTNKLQEVKELDNRETE